MGLAGSYFGTSTIFLFAAALCVPALAALAAIRPQEVDYARARNAGSGEAANRFHGVWELRKNRLLFIFAAALALFQLADAALLPMISAHLGQSRGSNNMPTSTMLMGALIVIPQIVVAVLAPWIGYYSERVGRKPLLMIGLGAQAVRAFVLVLFDNDAGFIVAQVLDGVSGAVIGVLTLLVIIDVTAGSGRFNLARGLVATVSGIAAAISTLASGLLIEWLGYSATFLAFVSVAVASFMVVLILLPETKPVKYDEDGSPESNSSERSIARRGPMDPTARTVPDISPDEFSAPPSRAGG